MSIKVFLADDHAVMRDGLRALLEGQSHIQVVGDAANGREAVRSVTEVRPDVVLLDIAMPELNGIEAARQIRDACPAVRVIILSMYSTAEDIFQALNAGARGYLLKESAGAEVIEAVLAVYAGRRYLSPPISDTVIDEYLRLRESGAEQSPLMRLSPREREILQLVVEGRSGSEIATILSLSPKTVETYRSRMMEKLQINDIPGLVRFAMRNGLTPPP